MDVFIFEHVQWIWALNGRPAPGYPEVAGWLAERAPVRTG
jgi:hypothetical protein